MKGARENFFEGEGPNPGATCHKNPRDSHKKVLLTANDMLYRIDPRLRRLAVRACRNSYAAAKVVGMFEEFVLGSFTINKSMKGIQSLDDDCWWKDLLLECPTITQRKDNHRHTAQFFFHSSSPTGGFHRLLLHAVCQFHGLNAASKMEHNYVSASNDVTKARALIVTGIIDDSSRNRLLGQLDDDVDVLPNSTVRCSPAMEQQMLALQV